MKKYLPALLILTLLSGCEDASKTFDKAKDAVNQAIDSVQTKINAIDANDLNLDKLGEAANAAKAFALSVKESLVLDFNDKNAIEKAQQHIANAYKCLVDASSESTAENLMNEIMAKLNNENVQNLLKKSAEAAKQVKDCVI